MAPSIQVFVQLTLLFCVVTTTLGGITDWQKSFSELENKVKVSQEEIKSLHQIIVQMEKRLEQLEVKDKFLERTRRQYGCSCPPGPKGGRGTPGLNGINGTKGEKGDPRPHGERGEKGELGLPGSPGPQGLKGTKGERGEIGQPGNVGQKGEPGLKGDQGPRGKKGKQGITGPQGHNGTKGERGEIGQPGNVGQKGPDPTPHDCREAYLNGCRKDGGYTIDPGCGKPFNVFCDMKNGGWTVFQRRKDGRENFNRSWTDYVNGFGDPNREFWIGLDKLNCLTSAGARAELRVDLGACDGDTAYARYSYFHVGNSDTNYTLTIIGYSGTAGHAMARHNGMQFSTPDRDNDKYSGNCAAEWNVNGWWFNSCYNAALNGPYICGQVRMDGVGIIWFEFKGSQHSLKFTEMKLRF